MFSDFKKLTYKITKRKLNILEAIYYRLNLNILEERYIALFNKVNNLEYQVSATIVNGTYIIAHAHSPEGKELGQFHLGEQLGPWSEAINAPKVYIDNVYKFSTPSIRTNHEEKHLVNFSGYHNIKCEWNGIIVDLGNVNIIPKQTTTLTFNFPRIEYSFNESYFLVGGYVGGGYANFNWFDINNGVSKLVSSNGTGVLINTSNQIAFHGDASISFFRGGWGIYLNPQNIFGYTTYIYNPNQSVADDYYYALRPSSVAAWVSLNVPAQPFNYWFCDTEQTLQNGGYPNVWLDWYYKYPLIYGPDIFQSHMIPAIADTNLLLFKGPSTSVTSPNSLSKNGTFRDLLTLSSIPRDLQGIAF